MKTLKIAGGGAHLFTIPKDPPPAKGPGATCWETSKTGATACSTFFKILPSAPWGWRPDSRCEVRPVWKGPDICSTHRDGPYGVPDRREAVSLGLPGRDFENSSSHKQVIKCSVNGLRPACWGGDLPPPHREVVHPRPEQSSQWELGRNPEGPESGHESSATLLDRRFQSFQILGPIAGRGPSL